MYKAPCGGGKGGNIGGVDKGGGRGTTLGKGVRGRDRGGGGSRREGRGGKKAGEVQAHAGKTGSYYCQIMENSDHQVGRQWVYY